MKRRYWWALGALVLSVAIVAGVYTWRSSTSRNSYISDEQQETLEAGLALQDVTLEQQDDDGSLLWRVHADEVTYSPDQESADLVRLDGELYQDGQLLYRVKANTGTIRDNGQVIFLEGQIVATGVQNQMVLRGQTLEWRPEDDVMIMPNGLTSSHPKVRSQANEARIYDRDSRMELIGEVIANTVVDDMEQEPWLKLQGEALEWQWETEVITSPEPLRVERFQDQRVTEVLTGQQGVVELPANQVTITEQVNVQIINIPLAIASEQAIWNIDGETVAVDRPIKIVNERENITFTAQKGQLDLAERVVYLLQEVVVEGDKNNSRLTTDRLTWNLGNQTLLAEGAVDYRQGDPQVVVRGPRAQGRIEEQTIVVNGGRVVTEITPNVN